MKSSGLLLLIITSTVAHALEYSGGSGTAEDPYQIATAEDLMLLGETPEDYDKHFVLTADIDLDPSLPGRKVFDRAVIAPDVNDDQGAFQGATFTGVFDGNGHTISHMTISGGGYLGLFGLISGASISELGMEAADVCGTATWVGGLVGIEDAGSSITNCYSSGTVKGVNTVGGLVGLCQHASPPHDSTIAACYSTCTVTGENKVGGLVGQTWIGGEVVDCYSTGSKWCGVCWRAGGYGRSRKKLQCRHSQWNSL